MTTFREVGRHEPFRSLTLSSLLLREVQQLVRLHGVRMLEQVEAVFQTRAGGDAGDPLQHLLHLIGWDAFVRGQVIRLAAVEVDGGVWRELE